MASGETDWKMIEEALTEAWKIMSVGAFLNLVADVVKLLSDVNASTV